jgi:hypothetical protein
MMANSVRCPQCGFLSKIKPQPSGGVNFGMPDADSNCEFLQEQKKSKGVIADWMCPHLKQVVERFLSQPNRR